MAINEGKWERADEFDPRRCKQVGAMGQCPYLSVPNQDLLLCERHISGPGNSNKVEEKNNLKNYRLQRYKERVGELAGNDALKNLSEEIGILRMVLEEIIIQCPTPQHIVAQAGKISDMTIRIRDLIQTCHKIDISLGSMLSRDKLIVLGNQIVEIMTKYITEPETIDLISEELITAIMTA